MTEPITRYLKAGYHERIRMAIESAEKQTSAEIVPMIVVGSTGTYHVFPLLFLASLILVEEAHRLLPMDAFYPLQPWMIVVGFFIIGTLLAKWLSRKPSVQRLLTDEAEQFRSVEQRALTEFYGLQMNKTLAKTGILLFLSLREHKAVVLADESIASKIPKDAWNEVIKVLVTSAKSENLTEGIVAAIQKCGDLVKKEFPPAPGDKNEIPDKLIIKS